MFGLVCVGGLGSCAAPNDGGIHQNFHFLRQAYQRTSLGWLRNASLAKDAKDYEINNQGEPKFSVALETSLESDAYALQCIRNYEKAKLVLWSWCSRGFSTVEDVARWHFNGNVALATRFMAPSPPGELAKYAQLESWPVLTILGDDHANEDIQVPNTTFLNGEKLHIWFVDCGMDGMVALPHWCSLPIECQIALWRSEHQAWSKKIAARAPKALPPSQQKQYDIWLENCTRKIVLDQQTKSVIKNPASCSKARLTKFGILLDPLWQTRTS